MRVDDINSNLMTFFELSLPFEQAKQKGKQIGGITPSERQSLEARIDALVHCELLRLMSVYSFQCCAFESIVGYTVIAVNHVIQSKFQGAIPDFALRKRDGVIILKRLTIILDEAGEKGCGLVRLAIIIVSISIYHCFAIRRNDDENLVDE